MPETEAHLNDTIALVIGILTRRRWWITITASIVALATAFVSLRLPNRFTSEATLMVVQQQVSQRFVESGTNTSAAELIQALAREILSRGRLIGIIEEFGLYSDVRQHATLEALAEDMRNDIVIEPQDQIGRYDYGAFKISFTARSARLAQTVTSRLTSLFIEENMKSRGDRATRTTSFLSEQLEAARKRLTEQEQRLQAFRVQNLAELPDQQQATFARVTDLRMQLQNAIANLTRAQQQRASLEVSIEASIRGNLASLESERATLLVRYTPRYYEVIKKDQEIAKWQDLLEHWKAGNQLPTVSDNPSIAAIRSQMNQAEASKAEIERFSKDQQNLTVQIEQLQNHLNLTPIREQQLAGILRDYEIDKKDYSDLQSKQAQSQLTTTLEDRQEGQQFRVTDPATLPVVPSGPQRVKICLGGLAGGLFLGLALAFLIDTRDHCFHFEKELSQSFNVPLVLGIPLLLTPTEERGRAWKKALEWLVVTAMALVVFGAEFYIYRRS